MYAPLLAHIARYVTLTDAEAALLCSYLRVQTVERKELLLRERQVCGANYFVLRGCLRTYLVSEKGTEQTILFGIENWWLTDYASLDLQRPSEFNIQAVEATQVVVFSQEVQEEVFRQLPQLERYFRLVLQRAAAAALFRIKFLYSMSGEERYRHFSQAWPGFVQRVPQYMLASFLGFTPEFLSKIRARVEHS
ncbi:Crp/Fnr family transcriptional regulator [Hymenobacter cellulosilyticus]|uniref:Crp/Fnr family transcriptional regulator n=1 Tax=Hymenobacter cellulosilyticus TaxID=2932248 RepID=A0A8T9QCD9_9BACT|nr:Crp/Fnr family transcriptional regulator [Hymenobacter cellulosilyticus]UOQ74031.1 Crp/Fnr family transcriptional regulator [Hymenobacter cellulosilyticus]